MLLIGHPLKPVNNQFGYSQNIYYATLSQAAISGGLYFGVTWSRSIPVDFPQRLASLRKAKGLNQKQLAEIAGVHVVQIRRYEYGQSQPTLDVLRKLALGLQVSADLLLFDEHERGPQDDFKLQFEALQKMSKEDRNAAKALLDGLILRHQVKVLAESH